MPHVLLMASVTVRDCSRRASLLLLLVLGAAAVVALRWLCIAGIGDELALLKELGVANLALGCAACAVLCAAPPERAQASAAAERALTSLPISRLSIPIGRWLGVSACMAVLWSVWLAVLMATMLWFSRSESAIFQMAGETTAKREISLIVLPSVLALAQGVIAAAVAVAFSHKGLAATAGAVLVFLVAGMAIANSAAAPDAGWVVKGLSWLVADLRYFSAGETLAGSGPDTRWMASALMQVTGYSLVYLVLSATLRQR